MSFITVDDILKMQARLAEIGPMPKIDAILITDDFNLIAEGIAYKALYEGKVCILLCRRDMDAMIEEATRYTPKHVRYDMEYPLPPGSLGEIVGIPVYDDTEKIREILFTRLEDLWKRHWSLLPCINPYSPISPILPSS